MNDMFFFTEEIWREYMQEMGIQETVDYLREKGLPANWPTGVVNPKGAGVCYMLEGKPWYKSECPQYEGYYLCGGTGSVQCKTAGELLPGVVQYKVCSKDYKKCPFFKEETNE